VSLADPARREVVPTGPGRPAGVAVRGRDAWVTDVAGGRLLQVVAGGQALRRPRVLATGLNRPQAVVARRDGLVVLEAGAGRVLELSRSGRVRTVLARGLTPANPPLPGRPTDGLWAGLAVDRRGDVLVSDPLTNRVLRVRAPRDG